MKDLRVLFAPSTEQAYSAHLADADGNPLGAEVPFTPFLEEDDYEDLRWYLEEYMELPDGGAVVRAHRIERNLETWGRRLHDALFTAPESRPQEGGRAHRSAALRGGQPFCKGKPADLGIPEK